MVYMVIHNVDDDDVGKEQRKAVGQCLLTVVSLMLLLQPITNVMLCYDCCYTFHQG